MVDREVRAKTRYDEGGAMRIEAPANAAIMEAARGLKEGKLVVIPTETVYGLACNALDSSAVKAVYETKGRPSDNPLIVHISKIEDLQLVARDCGDLCKALAERFWPGPLTLVLKKNKSVPDETTAGLDTIAVRMPSHPVALEIIEKAGCPIAAPSANPFMGLSPTHAKNVDKQIGDKALMVIDGGPCEIGLESTVLDLSGDHPQILRPGGIIRSRIQAVIGMPLGHVPPPSVRRSPGSYERHYAPNSKVVLVDELQADQQGLTLQSPKNRQQIEMPQDPQLYGAELYAALKSLDNDSAEEIFVQMPPHTPEWEAVLDRLEKASAD